jgi:hypothetical protein
MITYFFFYFLIGRSMRIKLDCWRYIGSKDA